MELATMVVWKKTLRSLAFGAGFAVTVGCQLPEDEHARGEALYGGCVNCHMADGAGNAEALAPSIAGQSQWYVEAQLGKFRSGIRGTHPEDIGGMRMRPMTLPLRGEQDIKAVAKYVSSLPAVEHESTVLGGDAEKGKALYTTCQACHGADGKGNQALNAPSLANSDWYLIKQLKNFKGGVRGWKAGDTTGAQMAGMTASLVDEQAMKDVVAYIQTL
jgi:cytochrome c553